MLLQKRCSSKYHSGGLWTNTCCSHPRPHESTHDAARRRLMEEMGIDLQPEFIYKFIYKTYLDKNLIEHEYDHVFIGTFDGEPVINREEVEDWKYVDLDTLQEDIISNEIQYTDWFKIIMKSFDSHIKKMIA